MAKFKRKQLKENYFIKLWRKIWKIEVKQELNARKFTGENVKYILKWLYPMVYIDDSIDGVIINGKEVKLGQWIIQGAKCELWSEKKLFRLYDKVIPEKYDDELEFAKGVIDPFSE